MSATTPLSKARLAARKHDAIAAEHDLIADMVEATRAPNDAGANDPFGRGILVGALLSGFFWMPVGMLLCWTVR